MHTHTEQKPQADLKNGKKPTCNCQSDTEMKLKGKYLQGTAKSQVHTCSCY